MDQNHKCFFRSLSILYLCASICLMPSACNSSQNTEKTMKKNSKTDTMTSLNTLGASSPSERKELTAKENDEVKVKAKNRNVLDYYRNLPNAYAQPYHIWKKDRLWMSKHIPSGKIQQAIVDLKNGYLEVAHEENNQISESIQVALFKMEDETPVLAICQTRNGPDQVQQNCQFLRPENSSQLDWTEHTLPVFTPFDFFSPEFEALLDSEYTEDAFPILIKLPQHGTELKVQLYLGRRFYYCGSEATESERNMCPLFDEMERISFTLKWNRHTGQFN